MMRKQFLLLLIVPVLLLSSCKAEEIKAEGEKAINDALAANTRAQKAQDLMEKNNLHNEELEDINYRQSLWAEWKTEIVGLGEYTIWWGYVFVTVFIASLAATSGSLTWVVGKIIAFRLWILAGTVPMDKETRQPRPFVVQTALSAPTPEKALPSPKNNSVLAKVLESTGLSISNIHGNRWIVLDPANNNVMARYDENRAPDSRMLEVERQGWNLWQTRKAQVKSSVMSRDGSVAAAMNGDVPGLSLDTSAVDTNQLESFITGIVLRAREDQLSQTQPVERVERR